MPDTTNPIGFTDANELREKNRATVEKYMNGCAATVEQREARVSGTGGTPPDGGQVGDVLREHHLGVPLQGPLFVRIEVRGQPAQVAVQRSDFVLRFDRHQAGAEQYVAQGDAAFLQLGVPSWRNAASP